MDTVRRWWPVPAFVVASLFVQNVFFTSRYDVSGHAAGHLDSATAPFFAFALIAILLYVSPGARRQVSVLAASAAWLGSTVLVLVGNVRVVDALERAGMAHTPTDGLVEDGPIEAAHDLANLAPWLGVATSLLLIGALFLGHHVTTRVAIGAAAVSVLFPPWIMPGAGVVVVTVARCLAYRREVAELSQVET